MAGLRLPERTYLNQPTLRIKALNLEDIYLVVLYDPVASFKVSQLQLDARFNLSNLFLLDLTIQSSELKWIFLAKKDKDESLLRSRIVSQKSLLS